MPATKYPRMTRPTVEGAIGAAARFIGDVLRVAFVALQRVRSPRPIHRRGVTFSGHLVWGTPRTTAGIKWIDDPPGAGRARVTARFSRSLGLPDQLPDVLGLAIRVETPAGHADIELASTGSAFPLRFALLPRWRPSRGVFTTLLPYRGEKGPVLLRARPLGPALPTDLPGIDGVLSADAWRLALSHARPGGRWHPFALLTLRTAGDLDQVRFDAGRHMLPGASAYPWVKAVRQPSYDAVQQRP